MDINKISIGLLFLILALVFVPGASAKPEFKPASNGLHMGAAAPNCAGECHNMPVFCARCHEYPYASPTHTANPVILTSAVTATLTATPQLTPKETKEIPDEEETQKETETLEEIETTAETPASAVTNVAASRTPTTPGFGIVAAIIGLFVLALVIKGNNR